jgi:carbamoyl-phosphate synthase large subunit
MRRKEEGGEVKSVLVPGASAPAGINTIKSLKMANFSGRIVATDSDPLAAGFYMTPDHFVMPLAEHEPEFVDRLSKVVQDCHVDVLMPSSGYDVYLYGKYRDMLEGLGAVPVVSDPESLEICRDKLRTFDFLAGRNRGRFSLPFTTADPDRIAGFPVIAKPRFGKGSRDIFRVGGEADLKYVKAKFGDSMIFQELLPGVEYTVDVLSDLDKKALLAVPRIRLQTKEGISTRGKVVHHPDLQRQCMEIAEAVGIRGPCCIQMKESSQQQDKSELKLVEINPRMGGGTIFSALAGANLPAMILDMVSGREVHVLDFTEVTVVRYFEEIVVQQPLSDVATATAAGAAAAAALNGALLPAKA